MRKRQGIYKQHLRSNGRQFPLTKDYYNIQLLYFSLLNFKNIDSIVVKS